MKIKPSDISENMTQCIDCVNNYRCGLQKTFLHAANQFITIDGVMELLNPSLNIQGLDMLHCLVKKSVYYGLCNECKMYEDKYVGTEVRNTER